MSESGKSESGKSESGKVAGGSPKSAGTSPRGVRLTEPHNGTRVGLLGGSPEGGPDTAEARKMFDGGGLQGGFSVEFGLVASPDDPDDVAPHVSIVHISPQGSLTVRDGMAVMELDLHPAQLHELADLFHRAATMAESLFVMDTYMGGIVKTPAHLRRPVVEGAGRAMQAYLNFRAAKRAGKPAPGESEPGDRRDS